MKKTYYKLPLLVLFLSISFHGLTQNCTVNADINLTICENEQMVLNGNTSGLFKTPSDLFWKQIAGPSVSITSKNNAITNVEGYSPGNSYTFRLTATCKDNIKAQDDVTITVIPVTKAMAGIDQTACPGSSTLDGNAPGTNENGVWSIRGVNHAGAAIANPTNPTSTFSTLASSAGESTLRWQISNSNGCKSFDDMVVTNYGGNPNVSTKNHLVNLGNCYSTTQCHNLNATFGGNGYGGQQGTWSQVSGPNNVTFSNVNDSNARVCGLRSGCYVVKWTVIGPCANGSDTVRICVPDPTQDVTTATASNQVFCDGRTIATLQGNTPIYSGETVLWERTNGPAGVYFADSSSPTTAVFGLDGTSTYTFRYSITNPISGCVSRVSRTISYAGAPNIAPIADVILPCGVKQFSTTLTTSGGNRTQYQIISAPEDWRGNAPTSLTTVSGSTLAINGLDTPGNYVVKVIRSTSNGVSCTDYSTSFIISVSHFTLGANAGTPQLLPCNIPSTALAGNKPAIGFGTWTQIDGPSTLVISDIYDPNSAVNGFINGVYNFRWSVNGGPMCPKSDDDVRIVYSDLPPQLVSAGPARTTCHSSPIRLDGSIPIPVEIGTWSVTPSTGVTIADVNNPKSSVNGLVANTAYTFQWKVSNMCGKDSSSVVITTNNTPGPPQANAGIDNCLITGTSSLTLSGNNPSPAKGLWTKISGPTATITYDTLYNTTVTGLTDGIYLFEWSNTSGTCDPTQDTVEITISKPVTVANAGLDKDSCSNSVTMTANTPLVGIGKWIQVSGPAGWEVNNINSPTARFTNLVTGEYKFIWAISSGSCASSTDTVTINIDNAPTVPTAGVSQKLCGNTTSLTLSGNTLTSGTATWSVIGLSPNTPSIVSPSANTTLVNNLVTGIYNFARTAYSTGGICPALRNVVSDTVVINAAAGPDRSFCGIQSSLGFTGPQFSVGTWSKLTGGVATINPISANSVTVTGTLPVGSPYEFVYTVPARWGCPQTQDTVKIIIDDTTNVPNAGTDKLLCASNTVTMDGNDITPNNGLWTRVSGPSPNPTIVSPTLYNTAINNISTAGIYLYRWTATNGSCKRSDEVRIEKFDPPTPASAGPDVSICPSEFTMAGNTAITGVGVWTQVSGPVTAKIEEPVNPKTKITGLTDIGTYRFLWSISNGPICAVSTDSMDITITHLNPTQSIAGSDVEICNNTSTALNGNNPSLGVGEWSQLSVSPTSTITDITLNNSALTLTTAGTYKYIWTITNGSCYSRDTVSYILSDLPTTSNAGGSIDLCIGEEIVLDGNDASPNTGTWRQISGPTTISFADSTNRNTVVYGLDTGVYKLRWQITSGSCPPSNDNTTITILKRPADAFAGLNQILCTDNVSLLGSQDSIGAPLWSIIRGPNSPTITTPNNRNTTVTGLTNGLYSFKYTITNGGCTNIDSIQVLYRFPQSHNTCVNAKTLTQDGTITPDSLCAATADVVEPATCGKAACNSLIYKIKTENTGVWKDLTLSFTQISTCSNGLRVSLFYDGPCPAFGSQVGTCQTINAIGDVVFPGIAPNTEYYIIVDDNSPVCGSSECVYDFRIGGALPIDLIDFKANPINNNSALLTWATASETNNAKFVIERKSLNGSDFTEIAEIKGAGNSTQTLNYKYIDNLKNQKETSFLYRLKQVDFNGDYHYSNINLVKLKNVERLTLYPNPAKKEIYIGSLTQKILSYSIYNSLGAVVKTGNTLNDSPIDINSLPAGFYFVLVKSDLDSKEIFKLSIE